ncbi:hypothetical protein L198_06837 [Cryptococcus wingfieldii CBS 7118]|uniref:Uncharacterized protein n=1 Tax=Cryptococcus wingfieldii CBS 7118 TaxID=1295528 RepID=A0A1E3IHK8_9TREE|nr:hypothetical protein L198_06837 [Cryptococcus wingfieldii CBS 7118]ODN88079.1 hypothetical protein L198_06837 [Cryptococcus wingfieldii CBS 7118]
MEVLHMSFHMDEVGKKRVYDHPATYEEMRVPGGPELESFPEFISGTAAKKVKSTPQAGSSAMGALESLGDQQYHAGPSSLGAYYPPNPVHPYNQPGQPQQPLAGPNSHHWTSLLYPSTSVHPHTVPAMPAQSPVFGYHRPVPTQARQQLPPSMTGGHTLQRAQSHGQLDANLPPVVSAAAAQHQMMVPSDFEEGFGGPRTRRLSRQEARDKDRRFSEKYQQMSQLQQLYPDFTPGQPSYSGLPNHIQPGFGSRLVVHQDLYGAVQAGNIHGPSNANQRIYGGRSAQVGSNDAVHLSQEGSAQAGSSINTAYDLETLYDGSFVHAGGSNTTDDAGQDQYLGSSYPQVNPFANQNLHRGSSSSQIGINNNVPFESQSLYGGSATHTGNDNTASYTLHALPGPSSGMCQPAPGAEYQDISPITNFTSNVDSIPSPPPLTPSSSSSGANIPQQHRNLTPEEMSNLLRCIDMSPSATAEEMFQTIDSPEVCMNPRAVQHSYPYGVARPSVNFGIQHPPGLLSVAPAGHDIVQQRNVLEGHIDPRLVQQTCDIIAQGISNFGSHQPNLPDATAGQHLPQQQPMANPEGCMDPRDMHLSYSDGVHGAPEFGPPPFDLESLVVPHDDGCLKGDDEGSCSVAADPDAGLPLWQ